MFPTNGEKGCAGGATWLSDRNNTIKSIAVTLAESNQKKAKSSLENYRRNKRKEVMIMIVIQTEALNEATNKIADYYGRKQAIKAMEEMAELQQVLSKLYFAYYLNKSYAEKKKLMNNAEEEIADTLIMLNQIIYLFNLNVSNINKIGKEKIDRQLRRIEYD